MTELGDVTLTPRIILYKVLYVPSFKFNLISIHSLTVPLKGTIIFNDTACLLQAPSMKRPQEIGRCKDGLYFLCSKCLMHSRAENANTLLNALNRTRYKQKGRVYNVVVLGP